MVAHNIVVVPHKLLFEYSAVVAQSLGMGYKRDAGDEIVGGEGDVGNDDAVDIALVGSPEVGVMDEPLAAALGAELGAVDVQDDDLFALDVAHGVCAIPQGFAHW